MRNLQLIPLAAASLFALGLLACSSDSEENNSTSEAEIASICEKYVERGQSCGDDSTLLQAECEGAFACEPATRTDAVANIFTCLGEETCTESDDNCLGDEVVKHQNEPAFVAFFEACQSKWVNECQRSDDYCASSFLNDDTLGAFSECMNKSCDEMESCLSGVIADRAPGCNIMQ